MTSNVLEIGWTSILRLKIDLRPLQSSQNSRNKTSCELPSRKLWKTPSSQHRFAHRKQLSKNTYTNIGIYASTGSFHKISPIST